MAHVTGGGLAANLARVMPVELTATLERGTWTPPPIFDVVRRAGGVPQPDLEATLNCGVGMVALLEPDGIDAAVSLLDGFGIHAWVAGRGRGRRCGPGAPSAWSVSTRAGTTHLRYWCAGTPTQQVALSPRRN